MMKATLAMMTTMAINFLGEGFMKYLLVTFALLTVGCAGAIDAESPGLCELKCSDPVPMPAEAKIRLLLDNNTFAVSCQGVIVPDGKASAPALGPLTIPFIVEKPFGPIDRKSNENGKFGGGVTVGESVPVGNIAFEPVLLSGVLAIEKTNVENGTAVGDNEAWDPYQYTGVVTPKSEWCTDSCGGGTMMFWPTCYANETNTSTVYVRAGGNATSVITISVGSEAQ